jgi:hypothetical protein
MITTDHTIPPDELMAYVDGELDAERSAIVAAHAHQCPACQQAIGELNHVSSQLSLWHVGSPPLMAAPQQTAGNLVSHQSRMKAPLWSGRWSVAAVFCAAAVVTGAWWKTQGGMWPSSANQARSVLATTTEGESVRVGGGGMAAETSPRMAAALGPERPTAVPFGGVAETVQGTVPPSGPRIIRTASLSIVSNEFDAKRQSIEQILQRVGGFVGTMRVFSDAKAPRSVHAAVHVPAGRLEEALAAFRALGRVAEESQGGEDVSETIVDLDARLANNRTMEQRLAEILKNRTGDVSDVLEVEREMARVRGEIERLDARRKNLDRRVTYAAVTLTLTEEREARLDTGARSLRGQFRNALVDGLTAAHESVTTVLLIAVQAAPLLLLWGVVLWWPVRKALRARGSALGARRSAFGLRG